MAVSRADAVGGAEGLGYGAAAVATATPRRGLRCRGAGVRGVFDMMMVDEERVSCDTFERRVSHNSIPVQNTRVRTPTVFKWRRN